DHRHAAPPAAGREARPGKGRGRAGAEAGRIRGAAGRRRRLAGVLSMERFDALLIDVGDQTYAMPLLQIQEIRGWTPVTGLPNADPACLGVLNLRGHVLPVFDARHILGKPTPEPRPQDVIVVAVMEGRPLGLLVDGVSDIVSIDAAGITRSEDEAWAPDLIDGIARVDDQLVPLLALTHITQNPIPHLPSAA